MNKTLKELHPADSADIIEHLSQDDREKLIKLSNFKIDSAIFIELNEAIQVEITKYLSNESIVFILKNYSKRTLVILLLGLGFSYIFLSHIIIATSGTYNYPSIHFREILFSIKKIDFILGNYGIYKLYSLEAIKNSLLIPLGLSNFELIYGARPHFMLGSLVVYGGFSIAIFTISYLYIFLKESIDNLLSGINENIIFFSILFAFPKILNKASSLNKISFSPRLKSATL